MRLLECTYVQYVIGELQVRWMMMMIMMIYDTACVCVFVGAAAYTVCVEPRHLVEAMGTRAAKNSPVCVKTS